jgi:adenine-specific DNA methylase
MLESVGSSGGANGGIVVAHYAGTYFGVRQALDIDRIRLAIARAAESGEIDQWTESVLLAGLLSAASECAFSAGKHYAQPHRIRSGKDLSFIYSRIVADRSKAVPELFAARVAQIVAAATAAGPGHAAERLTFEELRDAPDLLGRVDVVYADPPYTAQQYSRFYHVPEVICRYEVPTLQTVHGRVTRGLYPVNRFKSRFCSRRLAGEALRDLCAFARHHKAALLLSYSASRSGSTGNQRSIELGDLRTILREAFGRDVEERELTAVTYRQFNAGPTSVRDRADVELLFKAGLGA